MRGVRPGVGGRWDLLELGLEPFDVARMLAQLRVGGSLADAAQRPADGLCPAVGDEPTRV
jgi:hypothetical protein